MIDSMKNHQDNGLQWFESEQPDESIKGYVEEKLEAVNWTVDIVLSHTVPIEAEPVWSFIPGIDQSKEDKNTEKGCSRFMTELIFVEAGMQGITMSRVKKATSESCLKTMTRYANKYFVAKRRIFI